MRTSGKSLSLERWDDTDTHAEDFIRLNRKKLAIGLALVVPTLIIAVYSVSVSLYPMSFSDAVQTILNHLSGIEPDSYRAEVLDRLVVDTYIPRALDGMLVGAILAIGGAAMQSAIRNPLADSYTTGISSGAMFGVTIAVILGISLFPNHEQLGMISNAFIFSLIPTAVIVTFTYRRKTSPSTMILIGLGVMYIFSAMTTLLKYTADPNDIAEIYEWGVGTLVGVGWDSFPPLLISGIGIAAAMLLLSGHINVLSSGDNMAVALGVNAQRLRILVLVIVALCTASAVCFTGTIGFVGLVIPHIARILVGSNIKYMIPASAALGALLLLGSDCIARVIGPSGLPVGVITMIIGSPLFLYFLIKQRNNAWN